MFDGTPIPSPPFDAAAPLWALLFLLVACTAALRVGFGREWSCLTGRAAVPWREGGTTEHREGGAWWVLSIGWIGWMFAGAAWEWSIADPGASVSWVAVGRWWGVGVGTECLRWTTARFGAWLTLQPELLGGMTRMDRRLRVCCHLALHRRPPARCRSPASVLRGSCLQLGNLVCSEVDVDAVQARTGSRGLALGFCLPLHPRNHTLRWARMVRLEGVGLRPSLRATSSKTAWPKRSRPF
jgi:hypothetical protein